MKPTALIFWLLMGMFTIIASTNSHPLLKKGLFIWLAAFFILGIALIIVTIKQKVKGKLKFFLILTGTSVVAFILSVLLHNFSYGIFLKEDAVFFIIAVFVCPVLFLVGTVGSVVMLVKEIKGIEDHKKSKNNSFTNAGEN